MDSGNFPAFSAVQQLTDHETPLFNPHNAPTPRGPYTGQEVAHFSQPVNDQPVTRIPVAEPETPVLQPVLTLSQIGHRELSSTEVVAPKRAPKRPLSDEEKAAREKAKKRESEFLSQMKTAADSLKLLESLNLPDDFKAGSVQSVIDKALAGHYDNLAVLKEDTPAVRALFKFFTRKNNKKEFVEPQEDFKRLCETFGLEKPQNTTSTEESATEAFAESVERAVGEIREAFQTAITAHLPRPSKKSKTNQGDAVASMLNDVDIQAILLRSLYAADKTSALPRMAQAMWFTLGNYPRARRMAFSQGEYASEKVLEQNAAAGEGAVEVVVNATDN